MEFKELDRQFDETFERLGSRKPAPTAYEGPLAADHFLLTKSWAYFRGRLKAIEEQCQEIIACKTAELEALKKELKQQAERLQESEQENLELRLLREAFKKSREEDWTGFERDKERLQTAWEQEREAVNDQLARLEFELKQALAKNEAIVEESESRRVRWKEAIATLKSENESLIEKDLREKQAVAKALEEKDEEIKSRENRIDLMRGEVERRDLIIHGLEEKAHLNGNEISSLKAQATELKSALEARESEIRNLQTRLDILDKEKQTLRLHWDRQQAEWRELWDRSREQFDRLRRDARGEGTSPSA